MKNKLQIKIEATNTATLKDIIKAMHGKNETPEHFLVFRTVCGVLLARIGAENFDALFDEIEGAL